MISISNRNGKALRGKSLASIIRREHGRSKAVWVKAEHSDEWYPRTVTIAVLRRVPKNLGGGNIVEATYIVDIEDFKAYNEEKINEYYSLIETQ